MNIYCGNNALEPRLLSGNVTLGTNYDCLKKGIMKGKQLPKYTSSYQKIDNRKIYCGKDNSLPIDYDYMGNLPMCLGKGIGVGKARFNFGYNQKKYNIYFFILFIFTYSFLYLLKPKFLLSLDKNTKLYKLNYIKLIITSTTINLIVVLVVYFH